MRVTGGNLKGRKLKAFRWEGTKPSTDKTRQALINILGPEMDYTKLTVLDCYAGTGIVGLEFISRGVKKLTSIDRYSKCVAYMHEIKKEFTLSNWDVEKGDVIQFLKKQKGSYNLVFADPPYADDNIQDLVDLVLENNILAKNGIFVLEHISRRSFQHSGLFKSKKYGETSLSFYKTQ